MHSFAVVVTTDMLLVHQPLINMLVMASVRKYYLSARPIVFFVMLVVRGLGYGMESVRIDGNDVLATHEATSYARRVCIEENRPILIEAMTYRIGHHSTSDDSSKYRSTEEVNSWITNNTPIKRLKRFLLNKQLWTEQAEDQLIKQVSVMYSKLQGPKIFSLHQIGSVQALAEPTAYNHGNHMAGNFRGLYI